MEEKQKVVLMFSGGLDSTTLLYHLLEKNMQIYPVLFKYGQRHFKELKVARSAVRKLGIKPKTFCVHCDCYPFFVGTDEAVMACSILDKEEQLPDRKISEIVEEHIPSTYVPFRNVVFLAMACSYAEQIGAEKIFYGAHQVDYSGYRDCREEFIIAFNKMVKTVNPKISVEAPFLKFSKVDIVREGIRLKVDYAKSWSCYFGEDRPCLKCDSCKLRVIAFKENNMKDPLLTDKEWDEQLKILEV